MFYRSRQANSDPGAWADPGLFAAFVDELLGEANMGYYALDFFEEYRTLAIYLLLMLLSAWPLSDLISPPVAPVCRAVIGPRSAADVTRVRMFSHSGGYNVIGRISAVVIMKPCP